MISFRVVFQQTVLKAVITNTEHDRADDNEPGSNQDAGPCRAKVADMHGGSPYIATLGAQAAKGMRRQIPLSRRSYLINIIQKKTKIENKPSEPQPP